MDDPTEDTDIERKDPDGGPAGEATYLEDDDAGDDDAG